MKKYWKLFVIFFVTTVAQAQIYKWTDSSGNVHFSDKPQPGAQEIKLPPTQTYSPPPQVPIEQVTNPTKPDNGDGVGYDEISIVQPEDQSTIRNTEGYVSIIADLKPALRKGDTIQVLFDGSPLGKPQTTTVIALRDINRGSHTLAVQALSPKGKVLITSSTITIFMMQPRVNMGKGSV